MKNKLVFRSIENTGLQIDEAARTVELSFASDYPVERGDWIEVLDMHGMSMERIGSGRAALLVDHNTTDQVGVVESVTVGSDNVARAKVRFSRSARGQEIFQDVVDGIRSLVSVGYRIDAVELASTQDGTSTYKVTGWEPFEISIVSVPADPTVGVGRAADYRVAKPADDEADAEEVPESLAEEIAESIPESEGDEEEEEKAKESRSLNIQVTSNGVPKMTDAVAIERQRTADILAMGAKFKAETAAREFVAAGKSADEFRMHLLDNHKPEPVKMATSGISDTEARGFSFLKLIEARASGNWANAGFERAACEAAAKSLGRQARGDFIPMEVMAARASQFTAGATDSAFNLVQTDLRTENFIEKLQARMLIRQMGATVLDGLVGPIQIPKELGLMATAWVAEDGTASNTKITFGQVAMSPKTVLAKTSISRRTMLQSSMSVESLVRDRLQKAIAQAIDYAALVGGDANGPVGLLGGGLAASRKIAVGTSYSWDEVVALETLVATSDADIGSLGYITSPTQRGALKTTVKAPNTGLFIWENDQPNSGMGTLNGYRAGVTTKLSGVQMLFGDFSQILVGLWSATDMVVDTITDDSNAHIVKVFQDADVAIARQESFAYGAAA